MTLEEVKSIFRSGDEKAMKKALPAIESNDSLKTEVLEYYADILKYTGGKALADILKIPKNLATKKVRAKKWEPNANSIEILNHLMVDYLSLWNDPIPIWVKHTNFRSLSFVKCPEGDIIYPISAYEFEIRECGLEQIPDAVRDVNAKRLAFSGNRIKVIPDWVFETAERLNVGDNRIEKIELVKDSTIDTLRLGGNKITDISFLVHFPRLTFLVLSNNRISDFPNLPGSLLRYLYIDKCDFTQIPESFNALQKLYGLFFDHNPITTIPELKMPNLDSLDISGTPIGEEHNIKGSMSGNDTQAFLNRNKEVDNGFVEICRLLESHAIQKVEEAYDMLRANEASLKKAEQRYLKFIRARLGVGATIFDFGKAMYSETDVDALRKTLTKSNISLSLAYLDDATSKMLVDFLGSIAASVVDIKALKEGLAASNSEEELVRLGNAKLQEIRNAIYEVTQTYKDGWFGQLLYDFSSKTHYALAFDHTHFDIANTSPYAEAFFVFLQCFATDDYYIDVFQSDAPRFGEIFWLMPYIPKVIWFDVTPVYPLSPLSFKRSASLSENNAGKRIKSKLASEAAIESPE
ncbi:leucine-rich repeat domain-containing protein [Flavobacterium album]|nr:leucine-rich repeat domain-containing protein [Flavobacterium album]